MSDTRPTARGLTRCTYTVDDSPFQFPLPIKPSKIDLPTREAVEIVTTPQYANPEKLMDLATGGRDPQQKELSLASVTKTDQGLVLDYASVPLENSNTEFITREGSTTTADFRPILPALPPEVGVVKAVGDSIDTGIGSLDNCLFDTGNPRIPFQISEIKEPLPFDEQLVPRTEQLESPYADVVETTSLPILSVPEDKVGFFRDALKKMAESSHNPYLCEVPGLYPVAVPDCDTGTNEPLDLTVSFDYTPIIGSADYEASRHAAGVWQAPHPGMFSSHASQPDQAVDYEAMKKRIHVDPADVTDNTSALNMLRSVVPFNDMLTEIKNSTPRTGVVTYVPEIVVAHPLNKEGVEVTDYSLSPNPLNFGSPSWEPKKVEAMPIDRDPQATGPIAVVPQARIVSAHPISPEDARQGWSHSLEIQLPIGSEPTFTREEILQEVSEQLMSEVKIPGAPEFNTVAEEAIKSLVGHLPQGSVYDHQTEVTRVRDERVRIHLGEYIRFIPPMFAENKSNTTNHQQPQPEGKEIMNENNAQSPNDSSNESETLPVQATATPSENPPQFEYAGTASDIPFEEVSQEGIRVDWIEKEIIEPKAINWEASSEPEKESSDWSVFWGNKTEVSHGSAIEEVFSKAAMVATPPTFDSGKVSDLLECVSGEGPFVTTVETLQPNHYEKPTVYEIDVRDQKEPVVIELGAVPEIQELTTWAETAPPVDITDWVSHVQSLEKTWRVDGIILGQIYGKEHDPSVWNYLRGDQHGHQNPQAMKKGYTPLLEEAAEKLLKGRPVLPGMDQHEFRKIISPADGGYFPEKVYLTPVSQATHVIENLRREGDFMIGDLVCFSQEWYDKYQSNPVRALSARCLISLLKEGPPFSQEMVTWDLIDIEAEDHKRRKVNVRLARIIPDIPKEGEEDWSQLDPENKTELTPLLLSAASELLKHPRVILGAFSENVAQRIQNAATTEAKVEAIATTPLEEVVLEISNLELCDDCLIGVVQCKTIEMAGDIFWNPISTLRFRGFADFDPTTKRPTHQKVIAWDYRPSGK